MRRPQTRLRREVRLLAWIGPHKTRAAGPVGSGSDREFDVGDAGVGPLLRDFIHAGPRSLLAELFRSRGIECG